MASPRGDHVAIPVASVVPGGDAVPPQQWGNQPTAVFTGPLETTPIASPYFPPEAEKPGLAAGTPYIMPVAQPILDEPRCCGLRKKVAVLLGILGVIVLVLIGAGVGVGVALSGGGGSDNKSGTASPVPTDLGGVPPPGGSSAVTGGGATAPPGGTSSPVSTTPTPTTPQPSTPSPTTPRPSTSTPRPTSPSPTTGTPVPTTGTPADPPTSGGNLADELITAVNAKRTSTLLAPPALITSGDPGLSCVALRAAKTVAGQYNGNLANPCQVGSGSFLATTLRSALSGCGIIDPEFQSHDLLVGCQPASRTATDVVNVWAGNSELNEVLLNATYRYVGTAYQEIDSITTGQVLSRYWTAVFGVTSF